MTDIRYPDGIDCVWVASDRDRHLGAFVTGGAGPIPLRALKGELLLVEDIEDAISKLPKTSEAGLLVSMKRPGNFLSIAERGFFVYDWRDIHRTARESTNRYEPIVSPLNPITIDVLPDPLASLVADVRFDNTAFADGLPLDVCSQMACREGG